MSSPTSLYDAFIRLPLTSVVTKVQLQARGCGRRVPEIITHESKIDLSIDPAKLRALAHIAQVFDMD